MFTAQSSNDPRAFFCECARRGAKRRQSSFAKKRDLCAGCICVGGIVRHKDGLHAMFAQPFLQSRKQRVAGGSVERRKWLVEQ